jgi:hypothetical protein
MPITGKFEADFSQFSSATKGAEADLKSLGTTATTTTTQITSLEKASATTATTAGTLSSSWRQFDGALSAVGVHIGPQVQGMIDLGDAAGKTAAQLGVVASAGLVFSAAMAGWNFGRWIAGITGADQAIVNLTDKLMGTGLAAQTAGAQQDAIDLAFQRTGIHATSAAQALQLNTQWAKENQKAAKEAANEHKAWADAMVEVNSAGKGWQGTLETISGDTVEAVKYYLQAGVSQGALAKAYALTDAQVKAVASSLAAEKQALEAVAAARRLHDSELMDGYNKRIGVMKELETMQAGHYGLEGQIGMLQQLAANEDTLTKATYAQLDSEKDRMKVIEANAKRQAEIEIEIGKVRDQQTANMARSTLEAVKAQTELNKVYGLDAKGAIQLPIDALEVYRQKVQDLNATLAPGAELTAKLALAEHDLTDGLLAEAKATDTATAAQTNKTAATKAAHDQVISFSTPIGGAITGANTDPQILMYMGMGYTLNEAMAIAGGYGAQVIGANAKRAAAGITLPGRAAGGPVSAGGAYIVGERGPELFTPAVSGTISPGGGGISIVINGSVLSTQAELAALVERAMVAAYRRGGNRLPV